jgi:hypothetical protein
MQEQLGVATSAAPPFYVVLASYYASPRGAVSAEAVLFLLQVTTDWVTEQMSWGAMHAAALIP